METTARDERADVRPVDEGDDRVGPARPQRVAQGAKLLEPAAAEQLGAGKLENAERLPDHIGCKGKHGRMPDSKVRMETGHPLAAQPFANLESTRSDPPQPKDEMTRVIRTTGPGHAFAKIIREDGGGGSGHLHRL